MAETFRALFVGERSEIYSQLVRLLEGSDIVIDDVVTHDQVLASLARRDLFRRTNEPEGTPGRSWALIRHRITGRI